MARKTKHFLASILLLTFVALAMNADGNVDASSEPGQSTASGPNLLWEQINYPVLPPPRRLASMTINPTNEIGLLFGGFDDTLSPNIPTPYRNDLWLTNGNQWMEFPTPHKPGGRYLASFAYDDNRREAVLFGGYGPSYLGDTWVFDGFDWNEKHPLNSPRPRAEASMTYDAARNVTVLFGGMIAAENTGSNDMWIWDGTNWQQEFPDAIPSVRGRASMAYDPSHQTVVLFRGVINGGLLEDTWIWDGKSWIEQHPLHRPTMISETGMTFDENRKQVILFGMNIYNSSSETWVWDGEDWTLLSTFRTPPVIMAVIPQLVYMPSLQMVMLFNEYYEKSFDPQDSIHRSEVWVLKSQYMIFLPSIGQ